jgi:hypothetical protein
MRLSVTRTTRDVRHYEDADRTLFIMTSCLPFIRSLEKKDLSYLAFEIHFLLLSLLVSHRQTTDHTSPFLLSFRHLRNKYRVHRTCIALHCMYFFLLMRSWSCFMLCPCFAFVSYFSHASNICYSIK